MRRIIIADQSCEFSDLLSGALRSRFLVEVCPRGAQLLALLRKARADVLILDLMLPEADSLQLLGIIHQEDLAESIIVTSLFFSEYLAHRLPQFGVDYAALKPCSVSGLALRVEELCGSAAEEIPDPHCAITVILLSLGFRNKMKGFRYIRESLLMLARDPSLQTTKTVYPDVAKRCGATPQAVEKAIRAAILSAWESGDPDIWRLYFPTAPGGQVPRPTNTAFLSRIADVLTSAHLRHLA